MKKLLLPSKQELEFYLDKGASTLEISEKYGIALTKVRELCKANSIHLSPITRLDNRLAARDGHFVKSFYELSVDNWLFENNIEHVYEPRIPNAKRCRADFLANGFYIEIWGYKSKLYAKRKQLKREIYKQNGLSLIELSRLDFQGDEWQRKISLVLNNV
jgi:predicted nuclease of restriction endonuclease-like RecB superfamily